MLCLSLDFSQQRIRDESVGPGELAPPSTTFADDSFNSVRAIASFPKACGDRTLLDVLSDTRRNGNAISTIMQIPFLLLGSREPSHALQTSTYRRIPKAQSTISTVNGTPSSQRINAFPIGASTVNVLDHEHSLAGQLLQEAG
jgi:hypothetical protein